MGVLKSKEDKRIERSIQIRKTLGLFNRQVKSLQDMERTYVSNAREAKQINATQQYDLAKKALKQTMEQRKRFEQQLLTLKIANQMRDQAESHVEFAKALNAVSKTISEMFGTADIVQTQKDFEKAMTRARTMEERMDIFLETSSDTMFAESVQDSVPDEEIERLIAGDMAPDARVDAEISRGIIEIEREISKDQ